MRFYTDVHEAYRGSDLQARTVGCLRRKPRRCDPAAPAYATPPELFPNAMAPYRQELVAAVGWPLTWCGLARLCAPGGITCGLGHARYKAVPGGKAKQARLGAQKIAVLLRGDLSQPYAYPATRRATRDLRRRRLHRVRPRAEWLTPSRRTNSQGHGPALGPPRKSTAQRAGGVHRPSDPAAQQNNGGDLAFIGSDDRLIRDLEPRRMTAAQQHAPPPPERLRSGPGMGPIFSLVVLYAPHDIRRFPRGQDVASSGRAVTGASASAGTHTGPSGPHLGQAHRQAALGEAAASVLIATAPGQAYSGHLEETYGPAWTGSAPPLARAVYDRRERQRRPLWAGGRRRRAAACARRLKLPGATGTAGRR
jgi:hypothetical protein